MFSFSIFFLISISIRLPLFLSLEKINSNLAPHCWRITSIKPFQLGHCPRILLHRMVLARLFIVCYHHHHHCLHSFFWHSLSIVTPTRQVEGFDKKKKKWRFPFASLARIFYFRWLLLSSFRPSLTSIFSPLLPSDYRHERDLFVIALIP